MHRFTFVCLTAIIAMLPHLQAAPRPKRTNAKPAVIRVPSGKDNDFLGVRQSIVLRARIALHEDEKALKMDIIQRHKDWDAWGGWLMKNVRVERVKDTDLVHVRFLDGNAKEQAAIVNLVVDYYFKNDIASRRKFEEDTLPIALSLHASAFSVGHITAERKAELDEEAREYCEKIITDLPKLVEHAKAP